MKLFKGQVVHVKATVQDPAPDYDGDILVNIRDHWPSYIKPDNIIHAEPVQLAVGDLVTWGSGDAYYTVLCLDEGVAFLKHGHNAHVLHEEHDLRRAD